MRSAIWPIRTVSKANQRGHWAARYRRDRKERRDAYMLAGPLLAGMDLDAGLVITMTRLEPRLLDDDNLGMAFKAIRDGIADRLGINDRDPRVTWRYEQNKALKGQEQGVRVTVAQARSQGVESGLRTEAVSRFATIGLVDPNRPR